mmetsp:Transcript_43416/g.120128  ORF Transcript_43416/g.120128 Transcript_43416/m.120128 type:complete len:205 (+) Transcript_43416:78-692(+)
MTCTSTQTKSLERCGHAALERSFREHVFEAQVDTIGGRVQCVRIYEAPLELQPRQDVTADLADKLDDRRAKFGHHLLLDGILLLLCQWLRGEHADGGDVLGPIQRLDVLLANQAQRLEAPLLRQIRHILREYLRLQWLECLAQRAGLLQLVQSTVEQREECILEVLVDEELLDPQNVLGDGHALPHLRRCFGQRGRVNEHRIHR